MLEIVADRSGTTWRGVYTVRYPRRSTSCTLFRRNQSAESPLQSGISTSFTSVSLTPNACTESDRIDMPTKRKNRVKMERGSGNVFADLGLPHSDQELLRAKLTLQIYRLVKKRDLTQSEAGKLLGVKQPQVSLLMRDRAGTFSVERLMDFLTALGQDVEISVRPSNKDHGEVFVVA